MKVEIFGSTDVGQVRDHNEDNFVVCKDVATGEWSYKREEQFDLGEMGTVLFVADGMGGTNAGEVASEIAAASVQEEFTALNGLPGNGSDNDIMKFLKDVIKKAHTNIVNKSLENPTFAGMGTTAVVAWILKDAVFVAWSGDSRMYIYREGVDLYPNTDDHSMVWDLVKQGQLSPEQARIHEASNIITQSLGDDSRGPKPDARKYDLYKDDRVMLCSDGLCGMLSDNMMGGLLSSRLNAADTCKELIAAANAAGGTDNITVLLLDVVDGKPAPPPPAKPSGMKTAAGAGASTIQTSADSPGKGNNNKVLFAVAGLLILVAVLFFVFKDNIMGEPQDPDALDSLKTEQPVDTPEVMIPTPVENPVTDEPTGSDEPTGNTNTSGNKDGGNTNTPTTQPNNTPPNNNTPTKPGTNQPDGGVTPKPPADDKPKDNTPTTPGQDNGGTKPGTTPAGTLPNPKLPTNPPNDNNDKPNGLTPIKPGTDNSTDPRKDDTTKP